MTKKLISTAVLAVATIAAGSAFAGPNGSVFAADPSYAINGTLTRAEVNAQAVQSQREARALYANAEGTQAVAVKAAPVTRTRDEVKAEAREAVRVSGLALVNTPY